MSAPITKSDNKVAYDVASDRREKLVRTRDALMFERTCLDHYHGSISDSVAAEYRDVDRDMARFDCDRKMELYDRAIERLRVELAETAKTTGALSKKCETEKIVKLLNGKTHVVFPDMRNIYRVRKCTPSTWLALEDKSHVGEFRFSYPLVKTTGDLYQLADPAIYDRAADTYIWAPHVLNVPLSNVAIHADLTGALKLPFTIKITTDRWGYTDRTVTDAEGKSLLHSLEVVTTGKDDKSPYKVHVIATFMLHKAARARTIE